MWDWGPWSDAPAGAQPRIWVLAGSLLQGPNPVFWGPWRPWAWKPWEDPLRAWGPSTPPWGLSWGPTPCPDLKKSSGLKQSKVLFYKKNFLHLKAQLFYIESVRGEVGPNGPGCLSGLICREWPRFSKKVLCRYHFKQARAQLGWARIKKPVLEGEFLTRGNILCFWGVLTVQFWWKSSSRETFFVTKIETDQD